MWIWKFLGVINLLFTVSLIYYTMSAIKKQIRQGNYLTAFFVIIIDILFISSVVAGGVKLLFG